MADLLELETLILEAIIPPLCVVIDQSFRLFGNVTPTLETITTKCYIISRFIDSLTSIRESRKV